MGFNKNFAYAGLKLQFHYLSQSSGQHVVHVGNKMRNSTEYQERERKEKEPHKSKVCPHLALFSAENKSNETGS